MLELVSLALIFVSRRTLFSMKYSVSNNTCGPTFDCTTVQAVFRLHYFTCSRWILHHIITWVCDDSKISFISYHFLELIFCLENRVAEQLFWLLIRAIWSAPIMFLDMILKTICFSWYYYKSIIEIQNQYKFSDHLNQGNS